MSGNTTSMDGLRAKADQGDQASQFQLGTAYDYGRGVTRNQTEAAKWYLKAAEQGNAEAQNSLGSMFQYGEGLTQDNAEALRWYQKAADQGHGEANANFGYMYDCGLGVTEDNEKAVRLYLIGVEKGSINAMFNLGICYWDGEGTPKDVVKGYMWLDLARFHTQRSPNMQLKWRIRGSLAEIAKEMTKDQISEARKLGQEWDITHRLK